MIPGKRKVLKLGECCGFKVESSLRAGVVLCCLSSARAESFQGSFHPVWVLKPSS